MAGGLLAVLAKSCILCGPLVKRLRHGPFTAVTWVRFPYGSPKHPALKGAGCFSLYPYGLGRRTGIEKLVRPSYVPAGSHSPVDCGKERGRFPSGHQKQARPLKILRRGQGTLPTVIPETRNPRHNVAANPKKRHSPAHGPARLFFCQFQTVFSQNHLAFLLHSAIITSGDL